MSVFDFWLIYLFVGQVQCIFGDNNLFGEFIGDSYVINVKYFGFFIGDLMVYVYFIDINEVIMFLSSIFGLCLIGLCEVEGVNLFYVVEYVYQMDFEDNLMEFDLLYVFIGVKVVFYEYWGGLGYEILGGDGVNVF